MHIVRTNERGRYSIHLAAGNYSVRVDRGRFGYTPASATVSRQRLSVLNISIDTGIR
jgi:hypothetical protein